MTHAIVVCGSPGAGKTTYGRKLAAEWRAAFVDIDASTERLVRLSLAQSGHDPDDRDSAHFKQVYREPIYEQMFDIARDNLAFNNVVLAGPFTREIRDADWPDKLSRRLGAPVEVHYVHCPPEIRRLRLHARANARDRAKLADWDDHLSYYEGDAPPRCAHVRIEGGDGQSVTG